MDTPLLLPATKQDADAVRPEDTPAWRAVHAFNFLLGGTTFCAGTAALLPPQQNTLLATASAALYTLGSLGFLAVDVQEFFTFRAPASLRANIACSALGSTLYVLGSVGFFPSIFNASPALGVWGFILGSGLIAASQCCKLVRIGWEARRSGAAAWDVASSLGVEGGAAMGAALFLVGTLFFQSNAPIMTVLLLWMGGSLAFTLGGCCLATRHFVLKL